MPRKLRFRPSLADVKRANNAAFDHYALLSGRPTPEGLRNDVKDKRVNAPRDPDKRVESDVLKDIIEYLLENATVALVERNNSGAVKTDTSYVSFNTIMVPYRMRTGWKIVRMRKSDVTGMLVTGNLFAIEVKHPEWTKPSGQREVEQQNYLNHISNHSGIGIFAKSVDDVKKWI